MKKIKSKNKGKPASDQNKAQNNLIKLLRNFNEVSIFLVLWRFAPRKAKATISNFSNPLLMNCLASPNEKIIFIPLQNNRNQFF